MISRKPLSTSLSPVSSSLSDYDRALAEGPSDLRVNRQFRRLTDNIVREFPAGEGGTLLFAGVGPDNHIADVAGHVARQLAVQQDVAVVLVDADPDMKVLTQRFAAVQECGLAEVLDARLPLVTAILPTSVHNLRFLPFGDRLAARPALSSLHVKATLEQLRRLAQYVVVAAGMNRHLLHSLISRHGDGTYLVVQLGAADRQQTSELASHLTASGARLLGCVATGVV